MAASLPFLSSSSRPWVLPRRGLAVFYGCEETPRLAHYLLPGVYLSRRLVLFVDGANCFNPLLLARLACSRRIPSAQLNESIRVARAFTCFQLEELIRRLPDVLARFPAQVAVITGLPDLFCDEDISDFDAAASYRKTLAALTRLRQWPIATAVFSGGTLPRPAAARAGFFFQLERQAEQVWRFAVDADAGIALVCERSRLPAA